MIRLDWTQSSVAQEFVSPEVLKLTLTLTQRDELVEVLKEIFAQPDGQMIHELRLDLPREWVIFWKLREGDSRFLLAHPEPEQWVATLALERDHARKVVDRLDTLHFDQAVELGQLGQLSYPSNLELVIELRSLTQ